ncbi:hypothetical protein [Acinetobacter sp. AS5]|uniref:hypothetical protein n=1 Tax=Acinetobacter sp. AS5 TaxID=3029187 RepID=UPI003B797018
MIGKIFPKLGTPNVNLSALAAQNKKTEPFDVNVKQWSDEETDHCTDIKNHISPNTKVIEHD